LARALATDPDILLMDEPLANLDAQNRELMQAELLRIWMTMHKTTVFVTHDILEAIYLSDRVVVFASRPGRIREVINIDLPRPRALRMKRQAEFLRYEELIWEMMRNEVTK
jgi:NitT/TauT family transport system ATP-binding protein